MTLFLPYFSELNNFSSNGFPLKSNLITLSDKYKGAVLDGLCATKGASSGLKISRRKHEFMALCEKPTVISLPIPVVVVSVLLLRRSR
jgi:hypothetical protein